MLLPSHRHFHLGLISLNIATGHSLLLSRLINAISLAFIVLKWILDSVIKEWGGKCWETTVMCFHNLMQKLKKKYMVCYDFHVCVFPKLIWRIVNLNNAVLTGTGLRKWLYLEDSAIIIESMTHQRVMGQDCPTSFLFLSTTENNVCCSALCAMPDYGVDLEARRIPDEILNLLRQYLCLSLTRLNGLSPDSISMLLPPMYVSVVVVIVFRREIFWKIMWSVFHVKLPNLNT